jgi:arylformamidase
MTRPEDYPPQEPFSANARAYHDEVMRRGEGVAGVERSYGPDPYQSALVFPAERPSGDVLVAMHGGGWTNGYKEWLTFMAPALNARGVTFVSLGYRLAPGHVFPTGLVDCQAGFAWASAHVARHGGDPARMFVGGHSAGGHYASLMAVRRDWLASFGLPSDAIRGCLPISGVYDFREGSGLAQRPRFLGPAGTEEAASPVAALDGRPPPFLMVHGDRDFPHLMRQAVAMEEALRRAGGAVERHELAGCDHFGASYVAGDADGPWVARAAAWMAAQR